MGQFPFGLGGVVWIGGVLVVWIGGVPVGRWFQMGDVGVWWRLIRDSGLKGVLVFPGSRCWLLIEEKQCRR